MRMTVRYVWLTCLLTGLLQASPSLRYWVFFYDKPEKPDLSKSSMILAEKLNITERARSRRIKVLGQDAFIDFYDLPVSESYIHQLEALGAEVFVRSRWLNAISIRVSESCIQNIMELPFVKSVWYVRSEPVSDPIIGEPSLSKNSQQQESHALAYGYSYTQLNLIRVPEVHDLGLSGEGVLIGMLDTGFDTEGYTIFQQTHIVDKYDFYWNDDNPANQEGDSPLQHNHGTRTLSVVGGFFEGVLIGSAYGASYALAKTEWDPTETRLEEDLWVTGLEWLESIGADIVSSSLGYNIFDDPFSYTYEDLNGDICVTTIAADIAAYKGVLVLNSAGNERSDPWHYILSPADGDSVIAVGAVDWNGELSYFSSAGPTADGRTKPDVVAMGSGVYSALTDSKGSVHYVSGEGTSFSCPLVAGVCALVLEAHPELTPMQIRDAIRETADRSQSPDNDYGWGLVDAYKAVFYHGPVFTKFRIIRNASGNRNQLIFSILSESEIYPHSVMLNYREFPQSDLVSVFAEKIESDRGDSYGIWLNAIPDPEQFSFYVSLSDENGKIHTGPIDAPGFMYRFAKNGEYTIPVIEEVIENYILIQNTPNPFNHSTTIHFKCPKDGRIILRIFDIGGREVITLRDEIMMTLQDQIIWDGCDSQGNLVASGLYFCVLQASGFSETIKLILIR